MIHDHNVICFAPNDYWSMNPSCTTHLIKRLARENTVLYVNPFSSDISGASRKGFFTRLTRKIKSTFKFVKSPEKNLYVFSPVFLPFQGNKLIDSINNIFIRLQLKTLCLCLKLHHPIVWIENLRAADMLKHLKPSLTVYHVSDLFSACKYTKNKQFIRRRDRLMTENSDVVVCVSKDLHQLKSAYRQDAHYLPHGVDFNKFRESVQADTCLDLLADIPHPIAGYYGTMTANNDIETMLYCAQQLPDVSFVFAGQITGGDYSQLLGMPNVYHLGKLPYSMIPDLCAGFDICMLQWKVTDWIRSCNPLKLFEYMAAGKPIVSVQIDEVVNNYSDVITVAYSKEEFKEAIVSELNNDTPERSLKRIDIASKHSWDSHIEKLSQIFTETLADKHSVDISSPQHFHEEMVS